MAARKRGELFTILETSADTEANAASDGEECPVNLPVDVKWFELPFREPESDDEEELEEEEGESGLRNTTAAAAAAEDAADSGDYVAGGGCNIILVTGNGIKHDDYEDESYYASSNNCSETASTDSDIDFSDLEEEERPDLFGSYDLLDDECGAPDFWGEPDQVISIEPFTSDNGPQHSLGDDADTLDYFRLLFPDSLFEHMVEQTNNYALYRQRRSGRSDAHWHPTDVREMRAYVGLNVLMGINQLPDYGMYWASDIFIGNAGFKKTMTARRFEKLNQNLHLCDRLSEPSKGELGYDGLYKIRPLLDIVGSTMWEAYLPNRCLTIDECAIATKGRFSPTQYMPSKPLRKGLRVWMLCDSRSGYCHRTRLYVGKPSDDATASTVGHRVVTSLVRGLERRYHHLFMDSFFTSVPLLQRLLQDGLYACGPTNPNRRGYPDALKPRNVGKLSPGIVGIGPGKRDGEGSDGDCGSLSSLGIARPLPLLLYQENMRGVDLCDQLRECYQVGRPCKKWWRYFLWFYVNLCIVNAYIILRESRSGAPPAGFNGKEFTQRHFRVRLAQQLIGDYQGARGMERAARKRHADSPLEYGHRLERMSERSRRCRNCTNKGLRHESVFGCKICNVHLCRGGCFSEFHK
ncbi:piggyBac transposable element-derived protein 4-like [Tachysurus vachellii]|uniref:piggyBac transposable element-derived protein 4-like n=1 Tax=Tachysurus vachellii TaxID=175792 RepID=UPI00296B317E|nr:piggyBac transposable element-derived protein 4-like [Tachysurus vachellii]